VRAHLACVVSGVVCPPGVLQSVAVLASQSLCFLALDSFSPCLSCQITVLLKYCQRNTVHSIWRKRVQACRTAQVALLLNDASSSGALESPNCVLLLSLTFISDSYLQTNTPHTPFLPRAWGFYSNMETKSIGLYSCRLCQIQTE